MDDKCFVCGKILESERSYRLMVENLSTLQSCSTLTVLTVSIQWMVSSQKQQNQKYLPCLFQQLNEDKVM